MPMARLAFLRCSHHAETEIDLSTDLGRFNAMARAVIRGDYGNGDERKRRLGSYYLIVQTRVNEMLS